MAFRQAEAVVAHHTAKHGNAEYRDRALQHIGMRRAADAIENDPGDSDARAMRGKAAHQRAGGGSLAPRIDHENDRPAGKGGKIRRRAGAVGRTVEQAHDAFDDGNVAIEGQPAEQGGHGFRPHGPKVDVQARPSAGGSVESGIDIVRPQLCRGNAQPVAREQAERCRGQDRLAAARCRCCDNQPVCAHALSLFSASSSGSASNWRPSSAPSQSRAARSRTTSPTTTMAGGSMPAASASRAACARVVSSTR